MKLFTPVGRRWSARVALAATSSAIGLVATGAILSPASADAPVKVGWWNFAAAGGVAAPGPDAPAGGMRVSVTTTETLSFGAVQYSLPKDGSATLELKITQMTGNSNAPVFNNIVACPTKDNNWKAGDDQDAAGAPGYSCDTRKFVGHLSADQTTMTFLVDGSADVSDGVLSLAIVPEHSTEIPEAGTDAGADVTPPFAVDFDKPNDAAFTPDDNSSSDASSSSSSDTSSSSSVPPASTGASGGGAATPAAPPSGGVNVPAATTPDVSGGQAPVVAGQQPTGSTPSGGVAPAAAVAPVKTDNSKHDLLLVLLILILFGILYTQNSAQRMARGGAVALATPYPTGPGNARGLGRFNKERNTSARPLI